MLNVTSNYLRIEEKPNTGVYEYEVRFIPNVDMRNERFRLIRQIEPIIGDVRVSMMTFESKKSGQIAIMYHYCDLTRFFRLRR